MVTPTLCLRMLLAADVVTPDEVNACGDDAGAACLFVLRASGSVVLARGADWVVAKPLKILLIVAVAFVLQRLVSRLIRRFIDGLARATATIEGLSVEVPRSLVGTAPLDPRGLQRAETIGAVGRSLSKAIVAALALLMVLSELGLDLGPLIAGAGIVGVAVGFGAQSLVKDFLSGVFLVVEDQFGVGDVIDAGEASGVVEGISLRTTRLRDVEGTVWHIPNGQILRVGNKSQQWSRALLDVQVAYDSDLGTARRIIKEVADGVWHDEVVGPSVLEEPEVWGVEDFGPTGIAIRLVVKTRPADQWTVLRELRARMKAALDAAGISIGFQQPAPGPPAPPVGPG